MHEHDCQQCVVCAFALPETPMGWTVVSVSGACVKKLPSCLFVLTVSVERCCIAQCD